MSTFLIRLSGALPSSETWSIGVHVSGIDTIDDVLADAVDFEDTLWNGNGSTIPGLKPSVVAAVTSTSIVVYQLDDSTGKATARREQGVAHVGTASGNSLPQEVAVVATLRTSLPGPAGRGRLYLPSPAASTLAVTGRLATATRDDLAATVAGSLAGLVTNAMTPILFTPGLSDRTIVSVDVGDVYDSQRRRRDKLTEARHSVDL